MKVVSRNRASIYEGFHKGDLEGGLVYWGQRKMLSKARKWEFASIGAPLLVNMEGRFFLATLFRGIFAVFEGNAKFPVNEYLSTGASVGNLKGGSFAGTSIEKISWFLSWTQRTLRY